VRDRIPASARAHFNTLDRACETIDYCEGLEPCFVHGDAHYNNPIRTPGGDAIYLDFDSAGPGPAVVDLGFLLVNAHAAPIVSPPRKPDAGCVEAVIRGYCRYRVPPDAELDRLIHAIRFRPLVWACARFADAVKRSQPPPEWLLERIRMSDDLASIALDTIHNRRRATS
jgi:Ser/Thr protein kinase RdoA (MazF antagonist)